MANSNFSHCQECGRKLTSAIFCLPCKASFCTQTCYQTHKSRHASASAEKESGKTPPSKPLSGR
jgi:hypothetical protein